MFLISKNFVDKFHGKINKKFITQGDMIWLKKLQVL